MHKIPLHGAQETIDDISNKRAPSKFVEESMSAPKVLKQLGTLGGGNHFLEVYCSLTPLSIDFQLLCIFAVFLAHS